jgi:hypothetical protein
MDRSEGVNTWTETQESVQIEKMNAGKVTHSIFYILEKLNALPSCELMCAKHYHSAWNKMRT